MADKAHIETDKRLEEMERHLSAVFSRAQKETGESWKKYMKESGEEIANLQKAYDDAKKSGDDALIKKTGFQLSRAKQERTIQDKRFKALTEQLAQEILRVNETALAYINGQLPEVYALNYNAFPDTVSGDLSGYSFTLTDADTVKSLAESEKNLLPYKYMDGKKDVRWNVKKINAEVMQGIIQGESMDKIAGRFSKVMEMNRVSAIRNARTTVTSAENKGRQDSYEKATSDGIQLEREWISTNDGRTRHAHRLLDGETAPVDKPFHSELGDIMFPGDPHAAPANVYKCRCTQVAKVLGFAKKTAQAASGAASEAIEKVKSKFTPAKTIKEAEDFASRFASRFSFKGAKGAAGLDGANSVNEVLQDLTERFPTKKLKSLNTNGRLRNANARANFEEIEIRTAFMNDPGKEEDWEKRKKGNLKEIERLKGFLGDPKYNQSAVKRAIRTMEDELKYNRWSVSGNDVKKAVTHEYGHVIADQYLGQINGSYANKNFGHTPGNQLNAKCQEIKSVYKKAVKSGDIFNISMYAGTDEYEFFAETFAMYATGEKLPDYIREMMEGVLSGGIL